MRKENREFLYKKALNILIVLSFTILLLNIPIKPVLASSSNNSEVTIFYEDFEGVFPDDNDWSVADLDSNNGDDHWGASDYRAYGGTYSGWCAQVGERSGWTQIFREDFEEGFGDGINGWSVDDENPTGLDSYWDDVDSDFGGEGTSSGNYKAYCAGNGYLGTEISPSYRNYMDASMSRTLNLTDFDNADIAFYHKLISADVPWDYGQVLINDVEVKKYDSQQLTWDYEQISLLAYAGDVIEVTWNFHSDSADTYEGWYLDEILFFGNAPVDTPNSELHNYDLYMEAIMEMKEIDLSDYTSANLSYYYWMNIETGWDYLYVETSPDGLIWDTEKSYTGDSFGWEFDSVDLTPFIGSSVFIRFLFDSDFLICDFEGVYLDDIKITGTPQDDAGSGDDAGDDFDTATQIIPGSYEGFLESFDENDYFEVYVSASNVIKVNMTPSSGSNFDLALYDPDEDLIEESTLSGSAMESISYTVETSGDHFILVNYISGSSTYELEIEIEDNVPPTLSITSPTNGSEVKSSTVEVTWTGSDADTGIDHYEVKLDGGSWINVSTATSYNFTEVSDGSHTVYVKAVDGAENAKEAMVNFTVSTGIFGLDLTTIAIIAIIIIVVVIIIIFFFLRRGAPPTSTPPPSPPPVTPPT